MYILNEFFDKIFCINLDTRTDKWEECQKIFDKFDISVERVSPILTDKIFDGLKNTEYSLILTTIEIIEKSIKNNYKKILIFEDDIEFCDLYPDYKGKPLSERFKNSIEYLPEDWNLFYLGCGMYKGYGYNIGGEINSVEFGQTTHAYGINYTFFEKCLEYLNSEKLPLDNIYTKIQHEIGGVYAFHPNLISQRNSFSDIQNSEVVYGGLRNYMNLKN